MNMKLTVTLTMKVMITTVIINAFIDTVANTGARLTLKEIINIKDLLVIAVNVIEKNLQVLTASIG